MIDRVAWITQPANNTVQRVDTDTGKALGAPIEIGTPTNSYIPMPITYDGERIWLIDPSSHAAVALDPSGGRIVARGTKPVSPYVFGLGLGPRTLWSSNPKNGTLRIIDSNTANPIGASVQVGGSPHGVIATRTGIWVANESGYVSRLTNSPRPQADKVQLDGPAFEVVEAGGSIWASMPSQSAVAQIDPKTLEVRKTVDTGADAATMTVASGTLWVANQERGTVAPIDPSTATLSGAAFEANCAISDLATDGNTAWVLCGQGSIRKLPRKPTGTPPDQPQQNPAPDDSGSDDEPTGTPA